MKKYLLFLTLFIIGNGLYDSHQQVFGFEQESLPGTATANIKDENGNPIKKAAMQKGYFISILQAKI